VQNTLAREYYALITAVLFSRSKQWLSQRTAANKAEGRMSSRERQNSADLALKIDKN
jgi:hypothetical protein